MEKLIERMKKDEKNVGVIASWYGQYSSNVEKCRELNDDGIIFVFEPCYESLDIIYSNIVGFLWGLETVGYITESENDMIRKELRDLLSF